MYALLFVAFLCCSLGAAQNEIDGLQLLMMQNLVQLDEKVGAPPPCCFPDTLQFSVSVYRSNMFGAGNITVYLDVPNRRSAQEVSTTVGSRKFDQKFILLCNQSNNNCTSYRIDLTNRRCRKVNVVAQIKAPCIGNRSTHLGTFRLGSVDSESLQVEWWGTKTATSFSGLMVTKDCLPVIGINNVALRRRRRYFLASGFVVGIRKQIVNASVFDPPSFCNGAEYEEDTEEIQPHPSDEQFFLRYL